MGAHWPVVLVTQEIFGIHEHIKDICRRFARQGYYAIAPSLYARYGDPAPYTDMKKLVSDVVSKVPDAGVMSDLDAAAKFAGSDGAQPNASFVAGNKKGELISTTYNGGTTVLPALTVRLSAALPATTRQRNG